MGSLGYGYDAGSRRTNVSGSWARALLPDAVSSATYNHANQLMNWDGTSLTNDDNGNLISDGTDTYTWSVRNQLSQISGGTSATFGYDALGRRDEKVVGSATTRYVYDGLDAVQEKGALRDGDCEHPWVVSASMMCSREPKDRPRRHT